MASKLYFKESQVKGRNKGRTYNLNGSSNGKTLRK